MQNIRSKKSGSISFNMTPVIDVVFLLIIFFMLVCQFIVAENFEVTVPDDIESASVFDNSSKRITTVTVMLDETGAASYAVGAENIDSEKTSDISGAIAKKIDTQLQLIPSQPKIVCLRIDRDIPYRDSQYALAGISRSTATEIKLAVVKEKILK